jgi:uncharacterized protein RhaS with RHS repeats
VRTVVPLRRASKLRRPRALKSASRETFRKSAASRGRSAAYRFVASRDFAYAYGKPRQDRQFLQTDPLGYKAGDMNLYAYVMNDPLNRTDPTGIINCPAGDPNCVETPESEQQPGDPAQTTDEVQEQEEIVVTAQRRSRTTSGAPIRLTGDEESFFTVDDDSIEQRPLRQQEVRCPDDAYQAPGSLLRSGSCDRLG